MVPMDTATAPNAEATGGFLATTLLSAVLDTERSIAHLQARRPPDEAAIARGASRCAEYLAAVRDAAERIDRGPAQDAQVILHVSLRKQTRLIEAALDVVRHGSQLDPTTPYDLVGCAVCETERLTLQSASPRSGA